MLPVGAVSPAHSLVKWSVPMECSILCLGDHLDHFFHGCLDKTK